MKTYDKITVEAVRRLAYDCARENAEQSRFLSEDPSIEEHLEGIISFFNERIRRQHGIALAAIYMAHTPNSKETLEEKFRRSLLAIEGEEQLGYTHCAIAYKEFFLKLALYCPLAFSSPLPRIGMISGTEDNASEYE